jgi:uncharacterized protein
MAALSDDAGWVAERCAAWLLARTTGDVAHDHEHVRRVVAAARHLALAEGADLLVVLPAAWLHDCVMVPKDSPQRAAASRLAAQAADALLCELGVSEARRAAIAHAIEAHSFSAGIAPRTLEAAVVQDADRLDALGAIGLSRCLMLGGASGRRLYDPADPFAHDRPLDDLRNTIDHLPAKLLRLAGQFNTATARAEAQQRTAWLAQYLAQLNRELAAWPPA